MLRLNILSLIGLLLLSIPAPVLSSMGQDAVEIMFSQEIVAIDSSGVRYEPVIIDPATMPGMTSQDFDLARGRSLRIVTNLPAARQTGLQQVARIVQRSYDFIEKRTGGTLDKGVLLYILEFETLPLSYRFEATYSTAAPWQEVRVVLLDQGESLVGPSGSADLAELLFDTLPHELTHDVLADISPLLHDIDGEASHYTRWFIEGICELLAKEFAQHEAPATLSRLLAMRNVDEVLGNPSVCNAIFSWAQQNDNGMALESDLYGASMLLMMAWTETVDLPHLLARLNQCSTPQCGLDLELLMEATTGSSRSEMVERARQIGAILLHSNYLVTRMAVDKQKG